MVQLPHLLVAVERFICSPLSGGKKRRSWDCSIVCSQASGCGSRHFLWEPRRCGRIGVLLLRVSSCFPSVKKSSREVVARSPFTFNLGMHDPSTKAPHHGFTSRA